MSKNQYLNMKFYGGEFRRDQNLPIGSWLAGALHVDCFGLQLDHLTDSMYALLKTKEKRSLVNFSVNKKQCQSHMHFHNKQFIILFEFH